MTEQVPKNINSLMSIVMLIWISIPMLYGNNIPHSSPLFKCSSNMFFNLYHSVCFTQYYI